MTCNCAKCGAEIDPAESPGIGVPGILGGKMYHPPGWWPPKWVLVASEGDPLALQMILGDLDFFCDSKCAAEFVLEEAAA